jgi:hypothetical protein
LANRRFVPTLLQKSPRAFCGIEIRNNRIGMNEIANRCCALAADLESILLAQMRKIFLQQNLPFADTGRRMDTLGYENGNPERRELSLLQNQATSLWHTGASLKVPLPDGGSLDYNAS